MPFSCKSFHFSHQILCRSSRSWHFLIKSSILHLISITLILQHNHSFWWTLFKLRDSTLQKQHLFRRLLADASHRGLRSPFLVSWLQSVQANEVLIDNNFIWYFAKLNIPKSHAFESWALYILVLRNLYHTFIKLAYSIKF